GTPLGAGSVCLGDSDGDGRDDACYKNWVVADDFNLGCRNCRCDVNGDGVCDINDRDCVAFCAGLIPTAPPGCTDCSRADLNCDGVVDSVDLSIWNCIFSGGVNCCPQPLPLTRVRWYGSYLDPRYEPPNNTHNIDGWIVALYRDIPAVAC